MCLERNFSILSCKNEWITCWSSLYFICRGILLKDLVAVDGQTKDFSDKDKGILSLAKYRKLWQQLSRLHQYQVSTEVIKHYVTCSTCTVLAKNTYKMGYTWQVGSFKERDSFFWLILFVHAQWAWSHKCVCISLWCIYTYYSVYTLLGG